MADFKISLDTVDYESKPEGGEIGKICNRIAQRSLKISHSNFKTFVTNVATRGRTFSPATFKNGIKNQENFDEMQMLVLDFDNDKPNKIISWQQFRDRAADYNLPVLFAYETFNPENKNERFRAAFLNDMPISTKTAADITMGVLRTIFPEADETCAKDVSKMYFGGDKRVLHCDESLPTVDIDSLNRSMTIRLRDKHGDTNYKRKLKAVAQEIGVKLTPENTLAIYEIDGSAGSENGATVENDKNSPIAIIGNIRGNGENLSNRHYRIELDDGSGGCTRPASADQRIRRIHKQRRSSVIDQIRPVCRLFRDFEDGSQGLRHNELFTLATTLLNVESGSKLFLDTLRTHSHHPSYVRKYDYWVKELSIMAQRPYQPMRCERFCPHTNRCKHGRNILTTAVPRGIETLPGCQEELFPIEVVEADVRDKIENAVKAESNGIYVIKGQTSVGKTEIYLGLMKDSPKRYAIALSNNNLKLDVYNRAVKMGIDVVMSPSLHEIKNEMPGKVWEDIKQLYDSGRYGSVKPYIKETLRKKDIPCLSEYLKQLEKFEQFDGHAIITHKKLLTLNDKILKKYDVIIIDEDIILKSIIPDKKDVAVSDFKKLMKKIPRGSVLAKKVKQVLEKIKTRSFFTLPQVDYDDKKDGDDDTPTAIDVSSFCLGTHFCYRKSSEEPNLSEDYVSFFKPMEFRDGKYIMLSATADENICRHFFGADKVKFYDCKKAAYKGTLIQYADKSYSRACIADNPGIIGRITAWTGNKNIITFKKHSDGGELYYGKTEGVDYLKGQKIDIIGTPHNPEFIYKLFAYALGLDFDEDAKLESLIVTHNGYRFRFTTYKDEELRAIQFYFIESELEQAVGRARLLRCEEGAVNLFSKFPVSQAVFKEAEYDKGRTNSESDNVKDEV